MTKTVSFCAYRRPDYEAQVLASLFPQVNHRNYRFVPTYDSPAPNNRGCDANTFLSIQRAFDHGSDFNVHVEDDTVLSPDALALADWFLAHPERDNYVLLNLFSRSTTCERPFDVVESARFTSWGWAITREKWETIIKPEWNQKNTIHPMGWDWSVGFTIQKHGLKTLHPVLSRVKNIGREGGTYETPDHHDEWTKGLVQADSPDRSVHLSPERRRRFTYEYEISGRIAEMPPVDQWVTDEIKARSSALAVTQG